MTKEQKKQIIKEAYYMTQYASYTTDEGVYEALITSLENNETDFNLVIEFLELTHNATDFINQKVYDSVFYNLTNDKLKTLIKLYEAIENEDIYYLEDLFDISYYELFDNYVGDCDFFEMIANEDLKSSGLESPTIYWAYKIPHDNNIYELDIYYNFNEITFNDILERLFEEYELEHIL